jgi:hypothetical protein
MSVRVLTLHGHGGDSAAPDGPLHEPGDRDSHCTERTQLKSCVRALGLSAEDFDDKEVELLVDRGSAAPGEVFWELAQDALQEVKARGNHRAMSAILGTMARALHEQGQHHLAVQQEAHRAFLRGLAAEGTTQVEIDCRCGCPICKSMSGQRWLVSDALERLPVPHERCAEGFCQCWWSRGWSADLRTEW